MILSKSAPTHRPRDSHYRSAHATLPRPPYALSTNPPLLNIPQSPRLQKGLGGSDQRMVDGIFRLGKSEKSTAAAKVWGKRDSERSYHGAMLGECCWWWLGLLEREEGEGG